MEDLAKLTKEEEEILMLTEEIWYVFFYEKKGGKTRGVLGRDRTKDLLKSIL